MMKKIIAVVLVLVLVLGLVACGGTAKTEEPATYEIAMITDVGTIDDKSFNQGTWEGVVAYAEENSITHKYYKPTEQSTDAYLSAIQLAVKGGAKVVVTPGYLFEEPIYLAQEQYPEVNFILIDGYPN
ncbi:MAG: BMP family ABC transporter substrate-binding protein, partial [Peptostreptococcaceae bacterium]|nr:BMP family ABC transporter substrate-binding protein [Peptostreptococcaceae bacterium]